MMSRMGRASLMAVPSARFVDRPSTSKLMRFAKAAFKAATGFPSHLSVKSISFDVTSAPHVAVAEQDVRRALASRGEPLVAVVNNAGVSRMVSLGEITDEDAKLVFDVNVHGTCADRGR